jgi:hypothetical protein
MLAGLGNHKFLAHPYTRAVTAAPSRCYLAAAAPHQTPPAAAALHMHPCPPSPLDAAAAADCLEALAAGYGHLPKRLDLWLLGREDLVRQFPAARQM